jgi:hypothetical protein
MGASTVAGSGVVRITNSTLTGNTAQGGGAPDLVGTYGGSGYGAALFNLDGAVTLNDDTLAGNTVLGASGGNADGGAVYNLAFGNLIQTGAATSATLVLNNNILSNTMRGTDLAANAIDGNGTNTAAITGSANLVMSNHLTGTSLAAGVITVVADPQLDPLQQTDGPTPTMRLTPSSPAYGAGNPYVPGLPGTDQRGLPRVVNGRLDLGAFEVQNRLSSVASQVDDAFAVLDSNPVVAAAAHSNPFRANVRVSGLFADADLELHTAIIRWGDGTVSFVPLGVSKTGSFSALHHYRGRGAHHRHTITVSVLDNDSASSNVVTLSAPGQR